MAPGSPKRPPSFLTRSIFALATAHIAAGVAVQLYSLVIHDATILKLYFEYEAPLVLLVFGALQLSCAFLAYREFSPDRPLAQAWLYIVAASVCTLIGTVSKHFLAVNTSLNPLTYWLHGNTSDARALIEKTGTVVDGPVQMALLGTGLCLALTLYRKLGLVPRLRAIDLIPVGAATLYTIVVLAGILKMVDNDPSTFSAERVLAWSGDCLLSLLLVEAVFLFRAGRETGSGYLSKVWNAFAIGIFLAGLCSLADWLPVYGLVGKGGTPLLTYLWYAKCAALTVATAYQWEAIRAAKKMSRRASELGVTSRVRPNPS